MKQFLIRKIPTYDVNFKVVLMKDKINGEHIFEFSHIDLILKGCLNGNIEDERNNINNLIKKEIKKFKNIPEDEEIELLEVPERKGVLSGLPIDSTWDWSLPTYKIPKEDLEPFFNKDILNYLFDDKNAKGEVMVQDCSIISPLTLKQKIGLWIDKNLLNRVPYHKNLEAMPFMYSKRVKLLNYLTKYKDIEYKRNLSQACFFATIIEDKVWNDLDKDPQWTYKENYENPDNLKDFTYLKESVKKETFVDYRNFYKGLLTINSHLMQVKDYIKGYLVRPMIIKLVNTGIDNHPRYVIGTYVHLDSRIVNSGYFDSITNKEFENIKHEIK